MEGVNEKAVTGQPGLSKNSDLEDGGDQPNTEEPSSKCLTFLKHKGRYTIQRQAQLRNNLLAGCGFLELANAGDFAANVWNAAPSPPYAMALMALGGTAALGISQYAFRDAWLSRYNFLGLRSERRYLQARKRRQQQQRGKDTDVNRVLDSLLDLNFRETGTELVDRIAMDLLMGFGAVVVGVGTFMAIGGTNHSVWLASNLLSGYIGNVPCAFYGLANLMWSIYVWWRARRHRLAGNQALKSQAVKQMLKKRTTSVQLHAALSGTTGIVGGAASLVTATMWWGYVVLAPCIVASLVTNYLWRHALGYDRPLTREFLVDEGGNSVEEELRSIVSAQQVFEKSPPAELLSGLIPDPTSLASVMRFITKNQLFEDFCLRLLQDPDLPQTIFICDTKDNAKTTTVTIDLQHLQTTAAEEGKSLRCQILAIAEKCIREAGPTALKHRERHLLETLGCYICTTSSTSVIAPDSDTSAMVKTLPSPSPPPPPAPSAPESVPRPEPPVMKSSENEEGDEQKNDKEKSAINPEQMV